MKRSSPPRSIAGRAVVACVFLMSAACADTIVFDNFDSGRVAEEWNAQGDLSIGAITAPSAEAAGGPSGSAMKVKTGGRAVAFLRQRRGDIAWDAARTVSFWVHRSATEAADRPASTIELQLYEANNRTRLWRKVVLDHTGWKKIDIPTRWMAWSNDRAARWKYVDRLGVWFRDAAELTIDDITIEIEAPGSAFLSAEDIAEVALGSAAEATIKTGAEVTLISDATEAPLAAIHRHLEVVAADISETVPGLGELDQSATVVLFQRERDYRAFVKKYAARQDRQAAAPEADGFTFEAIATTWHKPSAGRIRPVLTHEFVHSYLARRARLRNRGEWLHEGMATYFQLKHHPQQNFSQIVDQGIKNPRYRSPLSELTGGKKISTSRYWQAMTVFDLLLSDPKYRENFESLFVEMQRTGVTELDPFVSGKLDTDWSSIESDWLGFCQAKYVTGE